MKDYYAILGVLPSETEEGIRRAYHTLAKKYHPDRSPVDINGEEQLKLINEAYAILRNPGTRVQYDRKYKLFITWQKQRQHYEARTVYSLVFDLEILNDLVNDYVKKFHTAIVNDPGIIDWLRPLGNCYLIVVDKKVAASDIFKFVSLNMPGKHHLILEVNINSHGGWLPKHAWDWISKYKLPENVSFAV
ncbi:DnaJ-like protein [Dinghuibacter silviterrae]|uniref:DnaJ-like protein n=2 Tax=Dinghuibacter silviterrae TaxID=1539049 RepID=A0A4R8DSZ0_9BACT|nr:DnaJ-like protein [Dinghuibacter silviterrae]